MSDDTPQTSLEPLMPEVVPVNSTDAPPASGASRRSRAALRAVETTTISYSGEIPPPWMLQGYEDVCPGAADRILTMAEEQARHRQSLERGVVLGNIVNARVVAVLGTMIVLASMTLAGFLASRGLSGQAIALVLTEIIGLTGVALYRNYTKKEERVKKDKNKQKRIKAPGASEKDTTDEPADEN